MNNSSEEVHSDDSFENTSHVLPSFPLPPAPPIASVIVGLVTGLTGMCANSVVFVALVLARRHFGNHVNTFITNQSAMDLFACIFLAVGSAMAVPGAKQNYFELGEIGNFLVCFLFRNRVLAFVCMNAEKFGLVIICPLLLGMPQKRCHVVAYQNG